jgi:hypothetical protein
MKKLLVFAAAATMLMVAVPAFAGPADDAEQGIATYPPVGHCHFVVQRSICTPMNSNRLPRKVLLSFFRKLSLVHEAADRDGAFRLRQHVADSRLHEHLADLVLDRGNGFGTEAVAVSGVFIDPE